MEPNVRGQCRGLAGFLLLGLAAASPSTAHAADAWTVLPVQGSAIPADVGETFRALLADELVKQRGGKQVASSDACADAPCAAEAGRRLHVKSVYLVSIRRLGKKLIVSASEVAADKGDLVRSEKMTVNRVEDLDSVATRLARSLVTGKSPDQTAELGTITQKDSEELRRRHGDSGFGMRVGGVIPLADSLGSSSFGVLLDLGYWYEATYFAVEARSGVRFSTNSTSEGFFFGLPVDVSGYYLPLLGDFTPFVGGGLGLRFIYEERPEEITVGTIIQSEHRSLVDDSGFGLGLHGKLGMLLFRTWSVRMLVALEYDLAFIELNNQENPQSLSFALGVIF